MTLADRLGLLTPYMHRTFAAIRAEDVGRLPGILSDIRRALGTYGPMLYAAGICAVIARVEAAWAMREGYAPRMAVSAVDDQGNLIEPTEETMAVPHLRQAVNARRLMNAYVNDDFASFEALFSVAQNAPGGGQEVIAGLWSLLADRIE